VGLVGQLVGGFRWANGFGFFLPPLGFTYNNWVRLGIGNN
jgi:hypothetical protein